MFPIGLAAVNQGYQDAAPAYWKRRELEDTQNAYDALGRTFMQMAAPQGAQPGSLQPPGMPSGPPPMLPQGGGPQSGGGLQGSPVLGPIVNSLRGMLPGGQGGPSPGMMTGPPGGMPVGGPQPPMGPPMGGGGPPMGPQPGGGMPPGGGPGMPPSGPGGASPQMQAPPAITQRLGAPPYDWRTVAAEVARANPGAPPAVIARSTMMLAPFMNQQSQIEMRMLNAQLAEQRALTGRMQAETAQGRLEETRRHRDVTETQGWARIDQRGQQLIEQKRANMEHEAQRATQFENTKDKAARDSYRRLWEAAMTDYHRTIRERIGAAGILDKKERDAILNDLREEEERNKERIKSFYGQFEQRGSPDMPVPAAPAAPRGGAPAQEGAPPGAGPTPQSRINQGFSAAASGGGQPIPQDQLAQAKAMLKGKTGPERQRILDAIQSQGFSIEGL
jgi:hypothetical protein